RPVVDEFLGVLFRTGQPRGTIGVVVGPSVSNFERGAFEAAKEVEESVTLQISQLTLNFDTFVHSLIIMMMDIQMFYKNMSGLP
ncbi:12346_t:CDS:2, partial [Dentiscutata heterogama]